MISIKKNNFIAFVGSKEKIDAEIVVDEVSELPEQEYDRYILAQGSLAYVVTSGEVYVMGGDGVWHNAENSENADLSNYYNKSQVDDLLTNKIDKATGMGLSSNDYTTAEKNKLSSLSNYDDTALKAQISAIHSIPTINPVTYSSLCSYADTLQKGEFQAIILKGSAISDIPVDDNIIIKINVYSANTAFMLAYPTGTLYCDRFYTISKVSGKWGKWYTFTGTTVETQTT